MRYGGRGIMIYWHVERNSLCIHSQLKSPSSSEVASMIEGVIHHCTEMEVDRQYVDSHGQSTIAFALCRLLGFLLLPRLKALKDFQMRNMYRHPRIAGSMARAQGVVSDLYQAFVADPALLPPDWTEAASQAVPGTVARDYIAGMTDRFALAEYSRVFHNEIAF